MQYVNNEGQNRVMAVLGIQSGPHDNKEKWHALFSDG